MQKNVASQKWVVYAFDTTDLSAKTGDAANITANLRIDGAGANAVDDENPTELEDGYYIFDLSQAETNGNMILIAPSSVTADIQVIGVPGVVFTVPPNFPSLGIESDGDLSVVNTLTGHTAQSADNETKLTTIQAKTDLIPASPAAVGSAMTLGDAAITASKFDESTAFPTKSADTGSTQIARVGADGDTLEDISDEIAALDFSSLEDAITGPGDYAVTITIRTTGGSPISGVSVWLNTSNDRTGSVAGTKVTDSNGQVSFNLEYTTYYVYCLLSGYSFTSANFTAAAGSVSFTKDIATAASAGSSDYYADSFITRAITGVREAVDEPIINKKYTDARVIHHLEKAFILVLNEKNRNSKTPATVKQTVAIVADTTKYVLPYVMGSLIGVYNLSSESGTKLFYDGRGMYNPYGRSVWLEDHTLHIQTTNVMGVGTELTAEWIPSGIARLHNGTCDISTDGLTVTFGATPNAGELDTHAQAYAGSKFRILDVEGTTVTGDYMQERNITAYDNTTRKATLDVALSPIPTTDDGNIYYEIAPFIAQAMDSVVPLYAAYRIASIEGNRKRADSILVAYRNDLRNVRLTEFYTNMPEAPRQRGDSFDNRRYGRR